MRKARRSTTPTNKSERKVSGAARQRRGRARNNEVEGASSCGGPLVVSSSPSVIPANAGIQPFRRKTVPCGRLLLLLWPPSRWERVGGEGGYGEAYADVAWALPATSYPTAPGGAVPTSLTSAKALQTPKKPALSPTPTGTQPTDRGTPGRRRSTRHRWRN